MAEVRQKLDMNGNEIKDFVVDNQGGTPDTGTKGRLIYLTTDNKLYVYNGTSYIALTTSESGEYQLLDEKDQPDGYAGLDGSGKLAVGQIPTGAGTDLIPLLKGTIQNGQGIKYNSSTGGFEAFDISTLYKFKGSATSAELDEYKATAQSGDVYNLTDERSFGGASYPKGTNWAFESTGAGTGNWEPLTGIMDLSGYQTTANLAQNLTSPSTSTYPSTQAVSTAVAAVSAIASAAVKANEPITAGTHTKITYDAKGLVTGGTNLDAADIPDLSAKYVAVGRLGTDVAQLVSGTVPLAQLPTGNGANKIPVLPSAGTAGQALVVNSNADGFEFRTVPSHSISVVSETWTGDGATANKTIPVSFGGNMPSSVTILDKSGNIVFADVQCNTSQVTVTMSPAPSAEETFTIRILG